MCNASGALKPWGQQNEAVPPLQAMQLAMTCHFFKGTSFAYVQMPLKLLLWLFR